LTAPDDDQQETQIRAVPDAPGGATSVSNKVVAEPPVAATDTPTETRTWAPAGGVSPAEAQQRGDEAASDAFSDRPHIWVAGAFVGGLVFAQLLKRLGGGDD
jgi:hypothetical protein